jgi:hypothetical protein
MAISIRIGSTLPSSGKGSEETPKEKYIQECIWKFENSFENGNKVLTKVETIEKQKCKEVINTKFSIDDIFYFSAIGIPILFFIFCILLGWKYIKKNEVITGVKADMSIEMPILSTFAFIISMFLFMFLYVIYIIFLSYKY